jgi:hypothetical protein
MKKQFLILLLASSFCITCEKDDQDQAIKDFLSQESVKIDAIAGEWIWLNTHGGYSGFSKIDPRSEGYIKSIVFSSQQNYFEIIDNHLRFQTYYVIDSTGLNNYGTPVFKIRYFENSKKSQNMILREVNDTAYLYLYDNPDCRDCVSTSVYRKTK